MPEHPPDWTEIKAVVSSLPEEERILIDFGVPVSSVKLTVEELQELITDLHNAAQASFRRIS